ncbi:hypothetical protein RclHR1_05700005 [Rhizophagus clarus]|uniref:Uncharacterized protein n=1 Tax=Rhizophagus clarus TaxID=94130 RepID=A0A2Z6S5S9_9GLOM|nr:hypothetical protein RclHR1_05700005 [Rhizophagus clarus]
MSVSGTRIFEMIAEKSGTGLGEKELVLPYGISNFINFCTRTGMIFACTLNILRNASLTIDICFSNHITLENQLFSIYPAIITTLTKPIFSMIFSVHFISAIIQHPGVTSTLS